ncbi:MAG: hypothetical protein LBT20_01690 [Clostridiales bacterium]|jgi:hypothetical protein|nr:hypothetical protein [Clostridiales bacterium]
MKEFFYKRVNVLVLSVMIAALVAVGFIVYPIQRGYVSASEYFDSVADDDVLYLLKAYGIYDADQFAAENNYKIISHSFSGFEGDDKKAGGQLMIIYECKGIASYQKEIYRTEVKHTKGMSTTSEIALRRLTEIEYIKTFSVEASIKAAGLAFGMGGGTKWGNSEALIFEKGGAYTEDADEEDCMIVRSAVATISTYYLQVITVTRKGEFESTSSSDDEDKWIRDHYSIEIDKLSGFFVDYSGTKISTMIKPI